MRTIILTGSTGGLGKNLARIIENSNTGILICVYRDEEKFSSIFGEKLNVVRYLTYPHDSYQELLSLVDDSSDEIVVILNAFSIAPIKNFGDFKDEDIDDALEGNILQNFRLLNAVVNVAHKQSRMMRVINLDSGAADHPLSGWGNYCASKAFINSALSVLSLENPRYKIVSFDPGVMDTDMQKEIRSTDNRVFSKVADFINYKENGVLRRPEDVADYIVQHYILDWSASEFREKMKK